MAGKVLYGITENTFAGVQFGAGALFKNLVYDTVDTIAAFETLMTTAATNGDMLGATDGGININISATYGRPSVDGLGQLPFKGGLLPETIEAYIEATLKEVSASKMQSIFPTGRFTMESEDTSEAISMKMNLAIADTDYYDNITWVGSVDSANGYIMIALFNAFGRANGAIAAVDGIAGGGIPYRVDANVASFNDTDLIPAEVKFYFSDNTKAKAEFAKLEEGKVVVSTPGP